MERAPITKVKLPNASGVIDTVDIRKIKLNGIVLTWSAYVVEDDEHGLWTFSPTGTQVRNRKADDEWIGTMGIGTEPGFVWLIPRDEWFFGAWWRRGDYTQVAVDACTVPSLVDGLWTWTDLELDICRNGDGDVWVEDEDEFDESLDAGLIDTTSEREAKSITDETFRRLRDRVPPFDDTGWTHHDATINLGLPPLEPPPV